MSSGNRENEPQDVFQQPEYRFDVLSGQLLPGHVDINARIEAGGHPADTYKLSDLLLTNEVDHLRADHFKKSEANSYSREECIAIGRWLIEVISADGGILTREVINRARILGVGPSRSQLVHPDLFGSLARFYLDIDAKNTKHYGLFNDWDPRDFARDIAELGRQLKRKPTQTDVNSRAKTNPKHPSTWIMNARGIQLREVLELAGWPNIHNMSVDDHKSHGVKFMFANDGLEPSVTIWRFLSKQRKGPSETAIENKFNGHFSVFKAETIEAYRREKTERERLRSEKLKEIEDICKGLEDEQIPKKIFNGAQSDDELIVRRAKYLVLNYLLPDNSSEAKFSIATMGTQTVIRRGFSASIRRINDAITAGDIESAALYLGVFDDIWPDTSYMETLRLPEEFMTPARKSQSRYVTG